jgi:hypothetical protein
MDTEINTEPVRDAGEEGGEKNTGRRIRGEEYGRRIRGEEYGEKNTGNRSCPPSLLLSRTAPSEWLRRATVGRSPVRPLRAA